MTALPLATLYSRASRVGHTDGRGQRRCISPTLRLCNLAFIKIIICPSGAKHQRRRYSCLLSHASTPFPSLPEHLVHPAGAIMKHMPWRDFFALVVSIGVVGLALGLEVIDAALRQQHHLIDLLEGLATLRVVQSPAWVARQQGPVTPLLFGDARLLLGRHALAGFFGRTLVSGLAGGNLAFDGAAGVEFALLAVQALRDRTIGGDATALAVHTGEDGLGMDKLQSAVDSQQAQRGPNPFAHSLSFIHPIALAVGQNTLVIRRRTTLPGLLQIL